MECLLFFFFLRGVQRLTNSHGNSHVLFPSHSDAFCVACSSRPSLIDLSKLSSSPSLMLFFILSLAFFLSVSHASFPFSLSLSSSLTFLLFFLSIILLLFLALCVSISFSHFLSLSILSISLARLPATDIYVYTRKSFDRREIAFCTRSRTCDFKKKKISRKKRKRRVHAFIIWEETSVHVGLALTERGSVAHAPISLSVSSEVLPCTQLSLLPLKCCPCTKLSLLPLKCCLCAQLSLLLLKCYPRTQLPPLPLKCCPCIQLSLLPLECCPCTQLSLSPFHKCQYCQHFFLRSQTFLKRSSS